MRVKFQPEAFLVQEKLPPIGITTYQEAFAPQQARYVKVWAKNIDHTRTDMQQKAWLFMDEICCEVQVDALLPLVTNTNL